MAHAGASDVLHSTGPCTDGFKVTDHQVVVFYREVAAVPQKILQACLLPCFSEIDTAMFAKDEAQTPKTISDMLFRGYICLRATDQEINIAIALQMRNHLSGTAYMPVARALYGIEYFHIPKIGITRLLKAVVHVI